MRAAWRPLTFAILSTCFVLLLSACGLVVKDASLFGGGAAAVSMTLTGPGTVMLGAKSQYAATVTGSSDNTVTWSVNGVAGGNAAVGAISQMGLYVAPANAPQSPNVTITATSVATPSVSKSLPVALAAPPPPATPPVVSTPVVLALNGPATVTLGTASQYTATITGSANTSVTWSVNGAVGGNATVGSISVDGLYTAPPTESQVLEVMIAATSVADPSVSQSMTVALGEPPTPPIISSGATAVTVSLSGATSVTLGTTSQYTAVVTGSTDTSVIWSVNGIDGGGDAVGSISANGLYTALATASGSSTVIITATSVADPYVSQSLTVALAAPPHAPPPPVTLSLKGPTNVMLESTSQYTATVTGGPTSAVIWSVDGIVGGDSTVGTISSNGSYDAPISAPASSAVTITATSVADSAVSKSLSVTLSTPPDGGGPTVTLLLSGPTTLTLGASAQYLASVTGDPNTAVTWTVNGIAGGNSAVGTISNHGRYTAPSSEPHSSKVTITATSQADTTVSQSLTVALSAPPPPTGGGGNPTVTVVLSGPTTVTLGASVQYSATVTGNSNTAVTWSVNGVVGGNSTVGTISSKGFYAAPADRPGSSSVTIKATSQADTSVSQTLTVALSAPTGGGGNPTVTLVLTGPATVTLGASAQYTAVVTGNSNKAVTWSVNGVVGGNSTVGTISSKGFYAAPTDQPGSSSVTITATSQADTSVSQSLTVALSVPAGGGPTVTLALSGPTSATLGATAQYAATVTGDSDKTVIWSVNGVIGGDASVGAISVNGLYTAPAVALNSPTVTITATSHADPSVFQSLTVTLASPPPPGGGGTTVTVTLSGATSVTLGATSQYVAIVTGSTNTAVTWSVDGVVGGEDSVGTISTKGLYTAPQTAPQSSKITITATSVADSTVSQSIIITLATPPPTITLSLSGAKTVTLGTTSLYTAIVTGSSNTAVTWSVNGAVGGSATDGTISTNGLYSAPATAPQVSTVTIAATSAADNTVAQSIVVSLVAPLPSSRIPANAIVSADLNASTHWQWTHDAGTPGSSQGSTVYPVAGMSSDNVAREFYMTYSAHGGEIYHMSFATDKQATHFVYDTSVYVADPSQLQNLEMDMNDVMTDGRTVILGTQCSSISNSWEYTLAAGGHPHWHASNIPCNPMKWSANTWHHIQIASHRDNSGVATYDWVNVDGQYTDFQNASGADALSLGWAVGDLLINFQIDGASKGSGSNTLYTDNLKVYRW